MSNSLSAIFPNLIFCYSSIAGNSLGREAGSYSSTVSEFSETYIVFTTTNVVAVITATLKKYWRNSLIYYVPDVLRL